MTSRNVALTAALAFVALSLAWSYAGCALEAGGLPETKDHISFVDYNVRTMLKAVQGG